MLIRMMSVSKFPNEFVFNFASNEIAMPRRLRIE